jgi:hypothetical protein
MDNVLTVQQVAIALKKDAQTIRYLLDNKLVSYGMSYRRRGSKRKSYIIYADKFFDETGIKFAGNEVCNE